MTACVNRSASPSPVDIEIIVVQTQTAIVIEQYLTTTSNNVTTQTAIASRAIQATYTPTFQPSPLPTLDCTNAAEVVDDNTADHAFIPTGEIFEKKWILRNIGTCTWTTDYALVFIGGEPLGDQNRINLPVAAEPNETIEIIMSFRAPDKEGYYESFWKLQDSRGGQFGLDLGNESPLLVKINTGQVDDNIGSHMLENPDWIDTFDGKKQYWYLGAMTDTNYELVEGKLIITVFQPIGDSWRIARSPEIGNFYLEMITTTGEICSGKDSYGIVIRAPDQPDGIIDSGYIFGFSCDGMYRIYRLDDGQFYSIKNWTASEFIRSGTNKTNRLGVRAEGENFQLFANGNTIHEFYDNTYASGLIGLMTRSEATQNFQIKVDQIAFWRNFE